MLIELGLSVVSGYVAASFSESLFHNHVLHAPLKRRRFWKKHNRLFGVLRRAAFAHNVVHHRQTFKQSHTEQFVSRSHREALDRRIEPLFADTIRVTNYGLSIKTGPELLAFCFPLACCAALAAPAFGPGFAFLMFLVSLLYPAASMLLHPHLHKSRTTKGAPGRWERALLRSRMVQFIAAYHYMHHQYPGCNFNLVPGADWILGTVRWPEDDDYVNLAKEGYVGLSQAELCDDQPSAPPMRRRSSYHLSNGRS